MNEFRREPIDPPLRNSVWCRTCNGEIEAIARKVYSFTLAGGDCYEWRHVATGLPTCTITYNAGPYDEWAAARKIAEAREARWAAEDVALAAAESES